MGLARKLNSFFRSAVNCTGFEVRKSHVDFGTYLSTKPEHQGHCGSNYGYDVSFFADRNLSGEWTIISRLRPIVIYYNARYAGDNYSATNGSPQAFDTVVHDLPIVSNIPNSHIDALLQFIDESKDLAQVSREVQFSGKHIHKNINYAAYLLDQTEPSDVPGVSSPISDFPHNSF